MTTWTKLPHNQLPAAPAGAAHYRVEYTAQGARGPVRMSGIVTTPTTPNGTLISYAHGTTGNSTTSAPSLYQGGELERYIAPAANFLTPLIDAGYTICQPDYEGLGIEDVPATYLHRDALAGAIHGLVEAAAAELGTQSWINTGFSQGGYAALGATTGCDLPLLGTVALAPGDTELVNKNLRLMGITPVEVARMLSGRAVRFFPIVLASALNAFETLNPDDFLSDTGRELVTLANTLTLPELSAEVEKRNLSGGDLFTPNADTTLLQQRMDEQRLELISPSGNVLVVLGDQDRTVNREHIKALVNGWSADGCSVTLEVLPGTSHGSILPDSAALVQEFIRGL